MEENVQKSKTVKKEISDWKIIIAVVASVFLLAVVIGILILTHIICISHEYADATCSTPKSCVHCGRLKGEALGHKWENATCTIPKTCSVCGEVTGETSEHDFMVATCLEAKKCKVCGKLEGDIGDHKWENATCTEPKTCATCGKEEGKPLGHQWKDATCTEAKTCIRCESTEGDKLGHTSSNWKVLEEATCSSMGKKEAVCEVCNKNVTEDIEMLEHIESDWIIEKEPTEYTEGTRVKRCVECEKELQREDFKMTEEELKNLYISQCESISYDNLSRYPDDYVGKKVKFSGKVLQVCSESDSILYYSTYRVATSGGYDNVVYLLVDTYGSDARILEDDRITFYGTFEGLYTYETIMGASITIPKITAKYVD